MTIWKPHKKTDLNRIQYKSTMLPHNKYALQHNNIDLKYLNNI